MLDWLLCRWWVISRSFFNWWVFIFSIGFDFLVFLSFNSCQCFLLSLSKVNFFVHLMLNFLIRGLISEKEMDLAVFAKATFSAVILDLDLPVLFLLMLISTTFLSRTLLLSWALFWRPFLRLRRTLCHGFNSILLYAWWFPLGLAFLSWLPTISCRLFPSLLRRLSLLLNPPTMAIRGELERFRIRMNRHPFLLCWIHAHLDK